MPGFIDGHCHWEAFWGELYLHLGITTCVQIETQQNGPWGLAQKEGTEMGRRRKAEFRRGERQHDIAGVLRIRRAIWLLPQASSRAIMKSILLPEAGCMTLNWLRCWRRWGLLPRASCRFPLRPFSPSAF
jgi:hypothetical protein